MLMRGFHYAGDSFSNIYSPSYQPPVSCCQVFTPTALGAGRRGSASPSGQRGQQGGDSGSTGSSDAEAAYHRMELLSHAIKNELQRDLHIHDSAILPNFVSLPQVFATCATPPVCRLMQALHDAAGHDLVQLAISIEYTGNGCCSQSFKQRLSA